MKNLDLMSYQELVDLERKIKERKKYVKENIITKNDISDMIHKLNYFDPLVEDLRKKGYNKDINGNLSDLDKAFYFVLKTDHAIFQLCDVVSGNYKPQKAKDHTNDISPRVSGSLIESKDNELYKEMALELGKVVKKYTDIFLKREEICND